MTMDQYQGLAARTSRIELSQRDHLINGCLGLAGEAGECADLLKKNLYQDHRAIREKLIEELGDVLWYVAETATALRVNLEDVAKGNIAKLYDRYPDGFEEEKSLFRQE